MTEGKSCQEALAVILPSLNPDRKFKGVVDGLVENGFQNIVIVDDGSDDEHRHWFDETEQYPQCHVLHHGVNKGKGRALKTAFAYVLEKLPEVRGVITIDGDGQHLLGDIVACGEKMLEHGDKVVMGCRDFSLPGVPPRSVAGNRTTSRLFRICYGIKLSDTQTGLRAIPRDVVEKIVTVYGDRFEYETNMLLAFKDKGIDFDEVKIRTVYIEENKSSHFRVIHDSWRIYKLILAHFFRYTLSSLVSAVVDTLCYGLLDNVLPLTGMALTATAGVGARVVSSLLNFFLNKKLVFQTDVDTKKAMLKYYMLALPQMAVQVLLTQGVYTLLRIGEGAGVLRTVIYAIVMTVLYFVSYMIQQRWVFAPQKSK